MSSKPMLSSLFRSVSKARLELCKNGSRWIYRENNYRDGKWPNKPRCDTPLEHQEPKRRVGLKSTCLAALYSICSLSGAWRPWMFLTVAKFIFSWFTWNCKQRKTNNHMWTYSKIVRMHLLAVLSLTWNSYARLHLMWHLTDTAMYFELRKSILYGITIWHITVLKPYLLL